MGKLRLSEKVGDQTCSGGDRSWASDVKVLLVLPSGCKAWGGWTAARSGLVWSPVLASFYWDSGGVTSKGEAGERFILQIRSVVRSLGACCVHLS